MARDEAVKLCLVVFVFFVAQRSARTAKGSHRRVS